MAAFWGRSLAYSIDYIPPAVVEEMRGSHQLGIFLRISTDPGLHMWFGVNDVPAGFDGIDSAGTVYYGGGRLIGIPSLEVLVNGTSDAVDFTVSGIDPATGAKMLDSIPEVRGAALHLGITTLDQYYQPMTEIVPIWRGTGSHVNEAMAPAMTGESTTTSLSLSVVSGENTRSRPAKTLWTPAHQKADYPTDEFCSQVFRYSRGTQADWPRFS